MKLQQAVEWHRICSRVAQESILPSAHHGRFCSGENDSTLQKRVACIVTNSFLILVARRQNEDWIESKQNQCWNMSKKFYKAISERTRYAGAAQHTQLTQHTLKLIKLSKVNQTLRSVSGQWSVQRCSSRHTNLGEILCITVRIKLIRSWTQFNTKMGLCCASVCA